MWATYPSEAVNGVIVSDRLFSFQHRGEAPGAGVVWPAEEYAGARRALADSERAIGYAALRAYLPWLDEAQYAAAAAAPDPYAHPVGALRRILVETRVYDSLAEDLWRRRKPDVLVLYVQGTDAIGHVFAPFAPPRQPGIDEADFNRYSGVPETYFRAIDRQLGRYRELAEERGAVLMLASDHGFLWGEGRPRELSSMATATAGKWHREDGIFVLRGPGVPSVPGHAGKGGIAQVAATVLALAGLPPGKGLAGPPLGGVTAASADAVDFDALPRAKPDEIAVAAGDAEELAKLRALGYLGSGESGSAEGGSGSTRTGGSFNNEGLLLEAAGRRREAVAAYERALALDSGLLSAAWNLSNLLFESGADLERADRLAVEAYAAGLPSGGPLLVARARTYRDSGRLPRSVALLDGALAARGEDGELRLFRGRYRIESGDCGGAAADFAAVTAVRPQDAVAHASLGMAKLCLGDEPGATRALRRSLELDPDQPAVSAALRQLTQR
jgi:tetratricopeptide (TPR) repeat protein